MAIRRSKLALAQGAIPRMVVIRCLASQGMAASRRVAGNPSTAVTRLTGAILLPMVVIPSTTLALALPAPAHPLHQSRLSALQVDLDVDHVL